MNDNEAKLLSVALGVVFNLITSEADLKALGDLFNRRRAEGRDLTPTDVEAYMIAAKAAREDFDAASQD